MHIYRKRASGDTVQIPPEVISPGIISITSTNPQREFSTHSRFPSPELVFSVRKVEPIVFYSMVSKRKLGQRGWSLHTYRTDIYLPHYTYLCRLWFLYLRDFMTHIDCFSQKCVFRVLNNEVWHRWRERRTLLNNTTGIFVSRIWKKDRFPAFLHKGDIQRVLSTEMKARSTKE